MTSRATSVRPRPRRVVRHLLVGLTVALVAALTPTGAITPAQAAPTLLSQGRPATASSTENAGTPASKSIPVVLVPSAPADAHSGNDDLD